MSQSLLLVIDLIAILFLTFGLYFPRHRRRAMVVAYLVANVGVVAVAYALSSSAIAAGLGLGLFGILSIIRLRSDTLDQQEVAYYFAALALGLLAGIATTPGWTIPILMGAILFALYIGDHPQLFARYRTESIHIDAPYTDEEALVEYLGLLLNAKIHRVTIRKVDLVNGTTSVEVRYELPDPNRTSSEARSTAGTIGGRR
jgi:hypothetical protein